MSNSILDEIRKNPKYTSYNSVTWFNNRVQEMIGKPKVTSAQMLAATPDKELTRIIKPGSMYSFVYSPKGKETLPYYDKFPLIFPFGLYNNGFIGLNFHYLPPKYRIILLNKLMEFSRSNKQGEQAYLRFSWAMIGSVAKYKEVQHCVKRYLSGYVKSRFIKVQPADWPIAAMLPMENFAKQTSKTVWTNSIKGI